MKQIRYDVDGIERRLLKDALALCVEIAKRGGIVAVYDNRAQKTIARIALPQFGAQWGLSAHGIVNVGAETKYRFTTKGWV